MIVNILMVRVVLLLAYVSLVDRMVDEVLCSFVVVIGLRIRDLLIVEDDRRSVIMITFATMVLLDRRLGIKSFLTVYVDQGVGTTT